MADGSMDHFYNNDKNETYEIVDAQARLDITGKVDKETGKGLSTNDYTTEEKNKLAGVETKAQHNNVFYFRAVDVVIHEGNVCYILSGHVLRENGHVLNDGDIVVVDFDGVDAEQLTIPNLYATIFYFNERPDSPWTPNPYMVFYMGIDGTYNGLGLLRFWRPRAIRQFVYNNPIGSQEIGLVLQVNSANAYNGQVFGHVGEVALSSDTSSNSEGEAATPKAVKTVRDLIPEDASALSYDPTNSHLISTNVQDAIDEINPNLLKNATFWNNVLDAQAHNPLIYYNRGDVVRADNKLYVALVDNARGAISPNFWAEVTAEDIASLITQVADKLDALNPVATGYAYVYGNLSSQYNGATLRVDRENDDSNNAYMQCRRKDGKYTIYLASYSSGTRSILTNDNTSTYKNVIAIDANNNATSDFINTDFFDYYNTELPTVSSSTSSTSWTEFRRFAIKKGYWLITVAINYPKQAGGGRSVALAYDTNDSPYTGSIGGSNSVTVGSAGADVETNVALTIPVKVVNDGYIHIMGRQNSGSTISRTHYVRARGIKLMGI